MNFCPGSKNSIIGKTPEKTGRKKLYLFLYFFFVIVYFKNRKVLDTNKFLYLNNKL
jgi:hypothetical protein